MTHPPTPATGVGGGRADRLRTADVETPDQDAAERARLEKQLASWREKHPETSVDVVVTHDSTAGALVEASRHRGLSGVKDRRPGGS